MKKELWDAHMAAGDKGKPKDKFLPLVGDNVGYVREDHLLRSHTNKDYKF